MDINDNRIEHSARQTEILRMPKQSLSTFGTTNIYYYLITDPAYSELVKGGQETVIREGRVITEKPRIVTPQYLSRLDGFSTDARRYFDLIIETHGPDAPGLFYTYRNEPKELNIVSDNWLSVANKINDEIEKRGDTLTSIIKGIDEFWDVSLLKFIYEITKNSLKSNLSQMGERRLLNVDSSGVPVDARLRIEKLFHECSLGAYEPNQLKNELDRWDIFEEYQDRFFAIFKNNQ